MKRAFASYRARTGVELSDDPTMEQVLDDPTLRPSFKQFATRPYSDKSFTRGGEPMQNEAGFDLFNAMESVDTFRQRAEAGATPQELATLANSMLAERPDDSARSGFFIDARGNGLNISNASNQDAIDKVAELNEVGSGRSQEFRDAVASYKTLASTGGSNEELATRAQQIYNTYLGPTAPKKVIQPDSVQGLVDAIEGWDPQEGIFTLDDQELRQMFDAADDVVATRMSPESMAATFDVMNGQVRALVRANDYNGTGSGSSFGYLRSDQFKQSLAQVNAVKVANSVPGFIGGPEFNAALVATRALDASKVEIFEAFNNKPKDGIKRIKDICEANGLDDDATRAQIASFLIEHQGNLNPASVGDYLSGPEEENKAVLGHFAGGLAPAMKGADYTTALREYLKSFELPGESQKIDRMVEAFGKAYMEQNPDCGIADGESSYVLAFQAIMLATDAHNPAIKNKMTFDQLKRNLRDVNGGGDFDDEFVRTFYEDLTKQPLMAKFAPVPPGLELNPAQLKTDATLTKMTGELGKKSFNAEEVLSIKDAKVEVTKQKPWYGGLTGYKSSVTVTDKDGNKATMEISKPGYFSKKEPTVTIKPVGNPGEAPSPGSVKLASQVAAGFEAQATPNASYTYQRDEIAQQVAGEKQFQKTGVRPEVPVPKVEGHGVKKDEGVDVPVEKVGVTMRRGSTSVSSGPGLSESSPRTPEIEGGLSEHEEQDDLGEGLRRGPEVVLDLSGPKVPSDGPGKVRGQMPGSFSRSKEQQTKVELDEGVAVAPVRKNSGGGVK